MRGVPGSSTPGDRPQVHILATPEDVDEAGASRGRCGGTPNCWMGAWAAERMPKVPGLAVVGGRCEPDKPVGSACEAVQDCAAAGGDSRACGEAAGWAAERT